MTAENDTRKPTSKGSAAANPHSPVGKLFVNVAFWQGMMFLVLVCLVWASEVYDLPNLIFDAVPSGSVDWFAGGVLSAAIVIVAFITVAHTYVLQSRILRGVIIVCSYCNRAKVQATEWQTLENYVSGKSKAVFSHGVCPSCYGEVKTKMETEVTDLKSLGNSGIKLAGAPARDTSLAGNPSEP